MKQTSVEWLIANLDIDLVDSDWYIEKAKEMEKQQIVDAFNEARLTHPMLGFKHLTFEDYLNSDK